MKKLLSILASVGLIATSSSAVVACSISNSGSLTIDTVEDLQVTDKTGKPVNSILGNYIEDKNSWQASNNQQAPAIKSAIDAYNKADKSTDDAKKAAEDIVNAALYNLSIPVFQAKIEDDNEYSLNPQDLYEQIDTPNAPINADGHDKATKQNKLELKVNMVKLGDILHILGTQKDKTLADIFDDDTSYHVDDENPINDYVWINASKFSTVFNTDGDITSKQLQKIFARPDKSLKSIKVEISTSPKLFIKGADKDGNLNVDMKANNPIITLNGFNTKLMTSENTKITKDGNPVDGAEISPSGELYQTVDIKFSNVKDIKAGDTITVTYTAPNGINGKPNGSNYTIQISVK